jgi:hypothetical protein
MYMIESAAHWYHTFKLNNERITWDQSRHAVLLEFDAHAHGENE